MLHHCVQYTIISVPVFFFCTIENNTPQNRRGVIKYAHSTCLLVQEVAQQTILAPLSPQTRSQICPCSRCPLPCNLTTAPAPHSSALLPRIRQDLLGRCVPPYLPLSPNRFDVDMDDCSRPSRSPLIGNMSSSARNPPDPAV